MGYSQIDRRWRNHPLGYGPGRGTIGEYGCFDTTLAMVATWAGWTTNPAQMDEALVAHGGIFQRDPTGTFDYLPDNALARLWPDRFAWVGSWAGLRSDLIAAALKTHDKFVMLFIHSAATPMHFVPLVGGTPANWKIQDSYDDVVKFLNSSYGAGSITKTIIVRALKPVAKPPDPKVKPGPVVVAPPVKVTVPPDPMALYSFRPVPPDDLHPPDQVTTLADAKRQADAYAGAHLKSSIDVVQVGARSGDDRGSTEDVVYHVGVGGSSAEAPRAPVPAPSKPAPPKPAPPPKKSKAPAPKSKPKAPAKPAPPPKKGKAPAPKGKPKAPAKPAPPPKKNKAPAPKPKAPQKPKRRIR